MEFLILSAGIASLYFVGNAIAVNLDYARVNKNRRYK